MTKHISFYVDDKLHANLKLYCFTNHTTMTKYIKGLIIKGLGITDEKLQKQRKDYNEYIKSGLFMTEVRNFKWLTTKTEYEINKLNHLFDYSRSEDLEKVYNKCLNFFNDNFQKWKKFDVDGYGLPSMIGEEITLRLYDKFGSRLDNIYGSIWIKNFMNPPTVTFLYSHKQDLEKHAKKLLTDRYYEKSVKEKWLDDYRMYDNLKPQHKRLFHE